MPGAWTYVLGLEAGTRPGTERQSRASMRGALADFLKEKRLRESEADDPAAVPRGAHHFLARSPAEVVLITLEDLWQEPEPQNQPGQPRESELEP